MSEPESERIDDLEARLAFQEQAIEQLSDTVFRQDKLIARLERRITELTDRTRDLADRLEDDSDDHQPPPHY